MSTREARTRATAAWRARTGAKLIQAYLHVDTVAKLDALVQARGASGRGQVLTELIQSAREGTAAPTRAPAEAAAVVAPTRPWRLKRSKADGWTWDVLVAGKVVGRMRAPPIRGGYWVGETTASPGAENRYYRKTRDELAHLLAGMAD